MADSDSGGINAMVAIIAIIAIIAIGYIVLRMLPAGAPATDNGTNINVDLPGGQNSSY
jgi:hypothetical protein